MSDSTTNFNERQVSIKFVTFVDMNGITIIVPVATATSLGPIDFTLWKQ